MDFNQIVYRYLPGDDADTATANGFPPRDLTQRDLAQMTATEVLRLRSLPCFRRVARSRPGPSQHKEHYP